MLRLGEVLNLEQPPDDTVQRLPVLILNAEGKQVAVVVDQLLAGREIVIKTLGNHLRRVHGVTGATLMGDGSVVLILNPGDLVSEPTHPASDAWAAARAAAATRKTFSVMIVDDSMSVRRVVSNLIQSAGWQPLAARDGLEALEMVHRSAQPPDLILLDIEMPRMDGYEFMTSLKGQESYRDIPIVILTSRAGEKHRRKALDLGADEYVVKPYEDEVLLSMIRHLVQESRKVVPA
jgi:chemosensory pili system protein ChpA (sensor histidine kinase/response regulator)